MLRLAALVSLGMLAACPGGASTPAGGGGGTGAGSQVAPAVVTDRASAEAAAGRQAEVRGVADDAMLGAEVTVGEGKTMPVYCEGLDRWPAALAGTQVVARGLLEQTMEFAAEEDPALPSAGTSGAVWILRSCTYQAAE